MRKWVWTSALAEGKGWPEPKERAIPARMAIRASSPGASPSVRAGLGGTDTWTSTTLQRSRRRVSQLTHGTGAPWYKCPSRYQYMFPVQ